ncbi:hypothetical protein AAU61_12210 [Desulfocarbo indianensis]|nr:hypothetical protein AAU61_12210 [Desulfocarbo indianensis]
MAKVAVALSGGVDSTLAAWLLKGQGHELVGLSLKLGRGPDLAYRAGAQMARELGIPHLVVDVAAEFQRQVVGPAVAAYAYGLTPNPCARCNARVKFPLLWRAAQEAGCSVLATGHYARLEPQTGGAAIAEGVDRTKSQAYFLARVRVSGLGSLAFPLGGMTKAQVREAAEREGLSAAARPESQDACFLPPGGWDQLMAESGAVRPGRVVDGQGKVLASHGGLHRFTVGQRRGLGVALGTPQYVLALRGPSAEVVVGPQSGLMATGLLARDALWHEEAFQRGGLTVRLRYTHPGVGCRVIPLSRPEGGLGMDNGGGGLGHGPRGRPWENGFIEVKFAQPQRAVAPGQLAVFYSDRRVVGSAWISQAIQQTDGS